MTTGEKALERLMAGNRRFVDNVPERPHQSLARREEIIAGQKPFAVVIGCSDSRVSPEILFDCGLGDLFVVRVAGNIICQLVMGSVEYAVEHVGVRLVMVLGHSHCGAVTATVEGGKAQGSIGALAEIIQPAVDEIDENDEALIDKAAKVNARRMVAQLHDSDPILKKYVDRDELKIIGAFYDLHSGRVELI
ncbi:MAG: carbonic anhydrase [Candidatus Zixiibacteriota bacterium]